MSGVRQWVDEVELAAKEDTRGDVMYKGISVTTFLLPVYSNQKIT